MPELFLNLINAGIKVIENPYMKEPILMVPKGYFEELKKKSMTTEEFKEFINNQPTP